MRTLVDQASTLYLGKQGENESRTLAFREPAEWEKEFGPGTVRMVFRAPDGAVLPVPLAREDTLTLWQVAAAHTAQPGWGSCELCCVVGDVVVKSQTYPTFTAESVEAGGWGLPGGSGGDHRQLRGREAPGQHPVEAISGLREQLARIPAPVEPITNSEMEEMLK